MPTHLKLDCMLCQLVIKHSNSFCEFSGKLVRSHLTWNRYRRQALQSLCVKFMGMGGEGPRGPQGKGVPLLNVTSKSKGKLSAFHSLL